MAIKQKMIPNEKAVPTGLLGIKRECEQIVRIAVSPKFWTYTPKCIRPLRGTKCWKHHNTRKCLGQNLIYVRSAKTCARKIIRMAANDLAL